MGCLYKLTHVATRLPAWSCACPSGSSETIANHGSPEPACIEAAPRCCSRCQAFYTSIAWGARDGPTKSHLSVEPA
jgi:hypothetical protein